MPVTCQAGVPPEKLNFNLCVDTNEELRIRVVHLEDTTKSTLPQPVDMIEREAGTIRIDNQYSIHETSVN